MFESIYYDAVTQISWILSILAADILFTGLLAVPTPGTGVYRSRFSGLFIKYSTAFVFRIFELIIVAIFLQPLTESILREYLLALSITSASIIVFITIIGLYFIFKRR